MSFSHHVFKAGEGFQRAGFNIDLTTSNVPAMLWSRTDALVVPQTAAVAEIVSDSTDDDGNSPLGTGARTVLLRGIDASFDEASEIVTLSGTTPVDTAQEFRFVDRVIVLTAGGFGTSNVGELTVRIKDTATSPFPEVATVLPGRGVSNGVYFAASNGAPATALTRSIPRSWYLLNSFLSVAQATGSNDFVRVAVNLHNLTTGVLLQSSDIAIQAGTSIEVPSTPTLLSPGMVLFYTLEEISSNNLQVSGFIDGGLLSDNIGQQWYRRHT